MVIVPDKGKTFKSNFASEPAPPSRVSVGVVVYPSPEPVTVTPVIVRDFLLNVGTSCGSVVGLPHDQLGEIPGAFVILKEGYKLDEKNIIDECKKIISDYKVPEKIIETDNIPRTGSGKTILLNNFRTLRSFQLSFSFSSFSAELP